jgi:hypothetical protein
MLIAFTGVIIGLSIGFAIGWAACLDAVGRPAKHDIDGEGDQASEFPVTPPRISPV